MAFNPVRALRGHMAHKVETTAGTAETLTAAEVKIRILNPEFVPSIQTTQREILNQSLSPHAVLTGATRASFSFESDLFGSTSGNLQSNGCEQHDLFQACGLVGTGTSSPDDGMSYAPTTTDTNWKALTMRLWYDSQNAWTLYGALGNFELPFRLGMPCRAKFNMVGCYDGAPTATALPTSGTGLITDAGKPPVLLSAACSLHSETNLIIRELTLRGGLQAELLENINAACGYERAYAGSRPFTGSVKFNVPRFTGSGDFNVESKLKAMTAGGLSLTLGSAENNKFVLTVPSNSLQFSGDVRMSKENGILVYEAPFTLNRNNTVAGEDEFTLLAD